ncbi:MAG: chemotaxis protein CheW [Thermodesulfobacterium sp.]|jgi:purine-binding chemotaxis protein CheW|nr:chemotaxis protein CheW [Thermodesulfobacterium sp.]
MDEKKNALALVEGKKGLLKDKHLTLITFYLGDFIFGIPAEKVVEINKDLEITPVPLADEFILGIMNLRGHIVTVMDLQKKIKLQGDLNYRLNLIIKKDNELLSFLVEKIGDILEVPVAKLEETPDRIEGLDREYIENIYQLPDRLLLLLNVNKLFEN